MCTTVTGVCAVCSAGTVWNMAGCVHTVTGVCVCVCVCSVCSWYCVEHGRVCTYCDWCVCSVFSWYCVEHGRVCTYCDCVCVCVCVQCVQLVLCGTWQGVYIL